MRALESLPHASSYKPLHICYCAGGFYGPPRPVHVRSEQAVFGSVWKGIPVFFFSHRWFTKNKHRDHKRTDMTNIPGRIVPNLSSHGNCREFTTAPPAGREHSYTTTLEITQPRKVVPICSAHTRRLGCINWGNGAMRSVGKKYANEVFTYATSFLIPEAHPRVKQKPKLKCNAD